MTEQKKKTVKGAARKTARTPKLNEEVKEAPEVKAEVVNPEVDELKRQLADAMKTLQMMQEQLAMAKPQVVQVMADVEKAFPGYKFQVTLDTDFAEE